MNNSQEKIYNISLLKVIGEEPYFLSSVYDLSSIGYFQRNSVKEFINFFSRMFIKRTSINKKQRIIHDEFAVHCYLRSDGLASVLVSDIGFKERNAFYILQNLMDKFIKSLKYEFDEFNDSSEEFSIMFDPLNNAIKNPQEFDKIIKVQQELDETIEIVHKTIDSVLERGEKLETLIKQSEDLSKHSQIFYKTTSSQNKCCIIS